MPRKYRNNQAPEEFARMIREERAAEVALRELRVSEARSQAFLNEALQRRTEREPVLEFSI